ncbi:ATP-grasp domain-containing protein [Nocardioides zeicaulis]|uniref:RimK family alpha-L-glutamate ligase n=1 Tax=Nocardioides zeicaulis TaxID=1776857 RepID=A0ABV6E3K3_9ACTN
MTVLLATSGDYPDGESGAALLDAALAERGVEAAWARWDDPEVDWDAADLVALRSTWDYVTRHDEFLAWTARLDQSRLLNGADVFAWNHDKRYLTELGDLPVVPTLLADDRDALADAVRRLGTAVVKPRVGAGGAGLVVVTDPDDPRLGRPVRSHPDYPEVGGPWVVQPLVDSVRTHGESSVYVIGGAVTQRFDKRPGEEDVRVNEEFGGTVRAVELGDVGDLVLRAADAMAARFGRPMDYLRVDLLRWEDHWVVSELELIEPGLYLGVSPANAAPFADLVTTRLF